MTTLIGGEPPDSPMGQSTTEGRVAIYGIRALVWTRGKVIELAGRICRRPVSMLLDSGSTVKYVSAQTCTVLGIHIEEEPTNEELQLADGSPVTTQGRVKLQIKCGKYKKCDLGKGLSPHAKAIDIGDVLVGSRGPRY